MMYTAGLGITHSVNIRDVYINYIILGSCKHIQLLMNLNPKYTYFAISMLSKFGDLCEKS